MKYEITKTIPGHRAEAYTNDVYDTVEEAVEVIVRRENEMMNQVIDNSVEINDDDDDGHLYDAACSKRYEEMIDELKEYHSIDFDVYKLNIVEVTARYMILADAESIINDYLANCDISADEDQFGLDDGLVARIVAEAGLTESEIETMDEDELDKRVKDAAKELIKAAKGE